MSSKELLQKRTDELARIYGELARKDDALRQKDAEILRLRAELERCRKMLNSPDYSHAETDRVCADALEEAPKKRDGNDEHHY